jgi:hypothetical protein
MFNLTDPSISFILISPEIKGYSHLDNNLNCERLCSVFYSKDYTVVPLQGYHKKSFEKSFLGLSPATNNDEIRSDVLHILEFLDIKSAIIKYLGEKDPIKIDKNGQETLLSFSVYESGEESKIYIHNGVSFSFKEQKRYFFPKKKADLKQGMDVEYFNNNKWNSKKIVHLEQEFDKMYNLLIKYEKLRVAMS